MTRDLFKLFDSVGVSHDELVSSEPQSLQDMSADETEQDLIIQRADQFLRTDLKIDYRDFANHVFFNSALDYFNITGEKIINEYPLGGTRSDLENFRNDLDGYQRHVLSVWPSRLGHLRFNPQISSSYIQVDDVGQEEGVTKTCLLSPGTGSITIEAWYNSGRTLTGSNHVSVLVQKSHPNSITDMGYVLYLSGSNVIFRVSSGSLTLGVSSTEVSAPAHIGTNGYVMAVLDRSSVSGTIAIYTGSLSKFPVLVNSSSVTFGGVLDVGSGSLYIGSGSIPVGLGSSKLTILYSGNLDDVRIWRQPLDLAHATSSYNRKSFARSSLVGLWRFNETGSTGLSGYDTVCYDHSGHMLNGRVRNYYSELRGSGSMFYEVPDPILDLRCPEVLSYVEEQQTSGSVYDNSNKSKMTDLVPASYLEVENDQDADLVKNFLYILARHYDRLKLFADHLPKMIRTNYGDYDQVPDSKLEDMARFFGWELPGGFADNTAIQYMLGRDIQLGELSNEELEQNLYEIKVQFWRRVMNNLAHIYKTKGTRESVQALMRSYGVNEGFVRLKEYGYVSRHRLEAQRITAEKSSNALQFGSGTLSGTVSYQFHSSSYLNVRDISIESRFFWPSSGNLTMSGSEPSGSLWAVNFRDEDSCSHHLTWRKTSTDSKTGSLILTVGSASLTMSLLPIFDDRWYNVSVVKETATGSYTMRVSRMDRDEVAYTTSSVFFSASMTPTSFRNTGSITMLRLGSTGTLRAQHWTDEFRLWGKVLSDTEMDDHCLNYQSYGSDVSRESRDLLTHWRLTDGTTANSAGALDVTDFSLNERHGTGSFVSGSTPFRKFLNGYNYIASPDFSWTQNKIRTYDGKSVPRNDRPVDSRLLVLEFNMIDQLNEDISQMNESLEEMNDAIGNAASIYRSEYRGLAAMRREYFRRLTDRLNFRVFVDMLDFFDRSFVNVVRKLVPARAIFMGDEMVVESHMLERPKHQYAYRPVKEMVWLIEGTIRMLRR